MFYYIKLKFCLATNRAKSASTATSSSKSTDSYSLMEPGGILVTCSCPGMLPWEEFQQFARTVAREASGLPEDLGGAFREKAPPLLLKAEPQFAGF